jgi:transposase
MEDNISKIDLNQANHQKVAEMIQRNPLGSLKVAISRISEETGITEATLYKWMEDSRTAGNATPGDGQGSEQWNSEDKFLVVMETYSMNQAELAEYCRKKGLYKEQIEAWRETCLNADG